MGNTPGFGGATFQTYVALLNPTASSFTVDATLYDTAGTKHNATIALAAGELKTYQNFLAEVFQYTGGGAVTLKAPESTGGTHNNRFILSTEVRTSAGVSQSAYAPRGAVTQAQALLLRYGSVWPPNLAPTWRLMDNSRGGSLIIGECGDEVFGVAAFGWHRDSRHEGGVGGPVTNETKAVTSPTPSPQSKTLSRYHGPARCESLRSWFVSFGRASWRNTA